MNNFEQKGAYYEKTFTVPEFHLYKDRDKHIVDRNLYDGVALNIAKAFFGISKTSLRNFYNDVKEIAKKPNLKSDFDMIVPSVMLLKSKVSYKIGRVKSRDEKGDDLSGLLELRKFINQGLSEVGDGADAADAFLVFTTLFEAVIGFHSEICKENNKPTGNKSGYKADNRGRWNK